MNMRWISAAALVMAVAAAVPSVVKADDRYDRDRYDGRRDRYEDRRERYEDRRDRHEHWRHDHHGHHVQHQPDFDVDVPLHHVPRHVLETANYERRGHRIESVQHVFRDGKYFYRFRIDDPGWRDRDMNIRVAANGRLLTIEEAARQDPRYGHRH